MKKNVSLKWQLFIGITMTYVLIIGAAIYFFYGIDKQIKRFKEISSEIENQASSLNELHLIVDEFSQSADALKTRTYILIGFLMIILLYIINRILKAMRELGQRSKETHLLNKEIKTAQKHIEDTNWILTESSKLNEQISGIDDENQIAQIAFEKILETLAPPAAAFYIQQANSSTYVLKQHIGVNSTDKLPETFLDGEGLMGHVAKSRKMRIIHENAEELFSSSSTLSSNQVRTIVLAPCVVDGRTWGILEIGGHYTDEVLPKIIGYLERIARMLAITIKSGQAHILVENLLGETQQQTEELEAQQEELRITNEELIYKTNLLEASEEELRVQQEELQQTNAKLEEKAKLLASRNEELHAAQQTVEEKIREVELASRYKSEFMANMSHELRTPLNSILILAKLLQDNKTKNLNTDQVKYAAVIHSAGSDLLQLINELLDLAKIEAGKVELNHDIIRTQEFANNIESLFATVAQKKDIQFDINIQKDVASTFVCDEYRLEQVLKNFLSNAFKFTGKNGKIQLTITREKEYLKFAVSDTGKGIPKEKQALIFEAFRQEDGSTSRKYGGTGLGLSISREIAILLGGHITLISEIDKGSTFTLTIPYQINEKNIVSDGQPLVANPISDEEALDIPDPAPTPIHVTAGNMEEGEAVRTLLIVEDDINFAEILREFAELNGFQVMLAHNGDDGIKKAQQFKPQAMILDVMLPISDGWEVLRTLKADPETKHIPVHMMSAASFNQRDFIEKGAIGFLSKPVSEDALKKAFGNIQLNIKKGIKKVLLVEDQEFQSDIIKSAFAEHHINVIQAFSAQSALVKLQEEEHIDCVILDIKLPDANGLDLLDQIKSMPAYVKTPVIVNTAYDLSTEQIEHIRLHTKAMVLKSGKSNSRLIDEVTLFLNKISTDDYTPIKNIEKLKKNNLQAGSLEGKKVLIADDDMRNVFALTTTLQEYHMEIEIANNGLEAVEIVNNNIGKIDIVLMDIMMPEMDGYEAIKKIRAHKQNANLPIIAVTAKAMQGDREKSIEIGASDYISKPIDIDKLISLMRVWLS